MNKFSFSLNLCTALTSGYPLMVLFIGFRVTNHSLQLTNQTAAFVLTLALPLVLTSYSIWLDWADFGSQYPRSITFIFRLFGVLMGGIGWLPFSKTWADDLLLSYIALTMVVLMVRLNVLPVIEQFRRIRVVRRNN